MSSTALPSAEDASSVTILRGAEKIGAFLFPEDPPDEAKRRVYHLASEIRPEDRISIFRLGALICARPSTLLTWIAEREQRALATE